MIDVSKEKLLTIREVPRRLPPRPTGRRVHISAVYRWLGRGLGGVRLEWTKLGNTRYTSEEALQRFADKLAQSDHAAWVSQPLTPRKRQKQADQAARDVDSILAARKKARPDGADQ